MPVELIITAQQARRFMLSHQLLSGQKPTGAEGVMQVFDRIQHLQFDPLAVAGRNHDIALQSRVERYQPALGDQLLYTDRQLLDSWDRRMGIIRSSDWPGFHTFHRQTRERLAEADGPIFGILDHIRAHIREHGATTASDLDIEGQAEWWFGIGNWGSPGLARVALEAMLLWGELVIANKDKGRKSYDFASKLLPPDIVSQGDPFSSIEEYASWRVMRSVAMVGLIQKGSSTAWMGTNVLAPDQRRQAIQRLLDDGELLEVRIEGLRQPYLLRRADWDRFADEGFEPDRQLRIIAPLDNLLWDKTLLSALFGFDYHWEVYDPPAKRKFGYYMLPILCGEGFVGRVEPVFRKADAVMRVKGLWWEGGRRPRAVRKRSALAALDGYSRFLGSDGFALEEAAEGSL